MLSGGFWVTAIGASAGILVFKSSGQNQLMHIKRTHKMMSVHVVDGNDAKVTTGPHANVVRILMKKIHVPEPQ